MCVCVGGGGGGQFFNQELSPIENGKQQFNSPKNVAIHLNITLNMTGQTGPLRSVYDRTLLATPLQHQFLAEIY